MVNASSSEIEAPLRRSVNVAAMWPILAFSAAYFTDAVLRASGKYFWFDELCTVYVCRLRDMTEAWGAVLHGADYNPPLFYVLTRAVHSVFGEGLVTTRLPEMIGVWVFCLSLYWFVAKRLGRTAGWIAMMFPLVTQVRYYASEARPHGIVLGFCGLAMVFWQRASERPRSVFAVVGFTLSLLGAFLNHCYAVLLLFPFALAESYRFRRYRRIDLQIAAGMVAPAVIASLFYFPLLRSFKLTVGQGFFPASFGSLLRFFEKELGPAMPILVLAVILLAVHRFVVAKDAYSDLPPGSIPSPDLILALGFIALPVVGVLLARSIQGPFINRYFQAMTAGVAILLAAAITSGVVRRWGSPLVAAVMFLLLLEDVSKLAVLRWRGDPEVLHEATIDLPLNTIPGNPMGKHSILASAPAGLRIIVLNFCDFLYIYHYAPATIASRIEYRGWEGNKVGMTFLRNIREACHLRYTIGSFQELAASNKHFLVYGDSANLVPLTKDQAQMEQLACDWPQYLLEVRIK